MNGYSIKWSKLDFPITVFYDRSVESETVKKYRNAAIDLNHCVGRVLFDLGAVWFMPRNNRATLGSLWITQETPHMGPVYCGSILLSIGYRRIKSAVLNVCDNEVLNMHYALEHVLGLWHATCEITILTRHITINIPRVEFAHTYSPKTIELLKKAYL